MSVKATLWQQRHKSSRMDEILSIILTSSKLCIDLKEDGCSSIMTCENLLLVDKCSNPGSDRTILKRAHSVVCLQPLISFLCHQAMSETCDIIRNVMRVL